MSKTFETILLTGTAAVGKSTLSRKIGKTTGFKAFEYGDELFKQAAQSHPTLSHSETRSDSEIYISNEDVRNTDESLQLFIRKYRNEYHVVIDSHAVSKESYGFRSEPFGLGGLQRANFSRIICLYCDPNIIVERTKNNPEGRPALTTQEAEFYQSFQSSVAITYSTLLGVPLHFVNSNASPDEVVKMFLNLIGSKSH
jgi:adenylate kinase